MRTDGLVRAPLVTLPTRRGTGALQSLRTRSACLYFAPWWWCSPCMCVLHARRYTMRDLTQCLIILTIAIRLVLLCWQVLVSIIILQLRPEAQKWNNLRKVTQLVRGRPGIEIQAAWGSSSLHCEPLKCIVSFLSTEKGQDTGSLAYGALIYSFLQRREALRSQQQLAGPGCGIP